MSKSLALCFAVFVIFVCDNVLSQNDPPVLIVAGDSWGSFGGPTLQSVLTAHGSNLKVYDYAIGGTTSKFWARDSNLLNVIVSDHPTTQYVWLSIGGNDVIEFMPNCTIYDTIDNCINILLPEVTKYTQEILDPLFAAHPNVTVIQFGYDLMNFGQNAFCKALGFEVLNGCDDLAPCINPQFTKIQTLYVDQIGTLYPDNVAALNLLGSLQAYENVTGASIGNPNLNFWSPSDLMMTNCIHPTSTGNPSGFDIIFNNLWDIYFAKQQIRN